jgi:hypothetical protein
MSYRTGGSLIERAANLFSSMNDVTGRSRHKAEQAYGGAGRDRTDDILLAKQALSQLSYGP